MGKEKGGRSTAHNILGNLRGGGKKGVIVPSPLRKEEREKKGERKREQIFPLSLKFITKRGRRDEMRPIPPFFFLREREDGKRGERGAVTHNHEQGIQMSCSINPSCSFLASEKKEKERGREMPAVRLFDHQQVGREGGKMGREEFLPLRREEKKGREEGGGGEIMPLTLNRFPRIKKKKRSTAYYLHFLKAAKKRKGRERIDGRRLSLLLVEGKGNASSYIFKNGEMEGEKSLERAGGKKPQRLGERGGKRRGKGRERLRKSHHSECRKRPQEIHSLLLCEEREKGGEGGGLIT